MRMLASALLLAALAACDAIGPEGPVLEIRGRVTLAGAPHDSAFVFLRSHQENCSTFSLVPGAGSPLCLSGVRGTDARGEYSFRFSSSRVPDECGSGILEFTDMHERRAVREYVGCGPHRIDQAFN